MKQAESPPPAGRAVLDRLGIGEDPLVGADPVSFLRSLAAAAAALAKNPTGTAAANARLVIGLAAAVRAAAGRAVGLDTAGPASPVNGDKRFKDPAYAENPLFFLLEQQYLLTNWLVNRYCCSNRKNSGFSAYAGSLNRLSPLTGDAGPAVSRPTARPAAARTAAASPITSRAFAAAVPVGFLASAAAAAASERRNDTGSAPTSGSSPIPRRSRTARPAGGGLSACFIVSLS